MMDAVDRMIEESVMAARGVAVPEGPGEEVVERVRGMGRGGKVGARRGRVLRWAVAAVVVLTVGGVWGILGRREGGNGDAGVAFADVTTQMARVSTVRYREVWTPQKGLAPVTFRVTVEMGGKYSRNEQMAPDGKGGERVRGIEIYNRGVMLNLDVDHQTGGRADYTARGTDAPHTLSSTQTLEDLVHVNPLEAKPLGTRVEGGKTLTGFHIERKVEEFSRQEVDVWVDPATKLPVRVEETTYQRPTDEASWMAHEAQTAGGKKLSAEEEKQWEATWEKSVRVLTGIEFDVPVDEGMFSVETPAGYAVREEKVGR